MVVDAARLWRNYKSDQELKSHDWLDTVDQRGILGIQQAISSICLFTSIVSLGYYLSGKPVPVRLSKIYRIGEVAWTVLECVNLATDDENMTGKQDRIVLVAVVVKLIAEKVLQRNPLGFSGRITTLSVEIASCIQVAHALQRPWVTQGSSSDTKRPQESVEPRQLLSPQDIKAGLDRVVIGQEETKITLAVRAHMHMISVGRPGYKPGNILLQGPSGSGKTLLMQTLAKLLDIPFARVDASRLSPAGYRGTPVTGMLAQLIQSAGQDVERAQGGIIYIDEIDKIARDNMEGKGSGQRIQSELLTLIEGGLVQASRDMLRTWTIDTSQILFIVGGSFEALPVEDRVNTQALINYGLKRELVGRFACTGVCQSLGKEELVAVLKESEQSILKQKQQEFQQCGVNLQFTEEAIQALAEKALALPTGVRGLGLVLSTLLDPKLYAASQQIGPNNRSVVITEEEVQAIVLPVSASAT